MNASSAALVYSSVRSLSAFHTFSCHFSFPLCHYSRQQHRDTREQGKWNDPTRTLFGLWLSQQTTVHSEHRGRGHGEEEEDEESRDNARGGLSSGWCLKSPGIPLPLSRSSCWIFFIRILESSISIIYIIYKSDYLYFRLFHIKFDRGMCDSI